jgi:hypothetical protein
MTRRMFFRVLAAVPAAALMPMPHDPTFDWDAFIAKCPIHVCGEGDDFAPLIIDSQFGEGVEFT